MVGAVDDVHVHVHDGVTADDAVEDRLFDALLAGRDVFLRDRAADNLVVDGQTLAALIGLDIDDDVAVLTATT